MKRLVSQVRNLPSIQLDHPMFDVRNERRTDLLEIPSTLGAAYAPSLEPRGGLSLFHLLVAGLAHGRGRRWRQRAGPGLLRANLPRLPCERCPVKIWCSVRSVVLKDF